MKLWTSDKRKLTSQARLGISIFNRVNKGVDALHIKNHVRHKCRNEYPKVIKKLRETFKNPNTEAAEQTFIWLGKYKKILNTMDKRKHQFFTLPCQRKKRLHAILFGEPDYTMST